MIKWTEPLLRQFAGCEISHKTFAHLDTIERPARQDLKQGSDSLSWYCVHHNEFTASQND